MKTFIKIILFSLALTSAHAARVEDVKVLDLKFKKDFFEVKLQIKDGKPDSFFTVEIIKDDEKAFNKLALVMKKIKKQDGYKLNLDIPSFSAYPSGSHYRSDSVKFTGSSDEESLINP
jgi:hypothetical protein